MNNITRRCFNSKFCSQFNLIHYDSLYKKDLDKSPTFQIFDSLIMKSLRIPV